MVSSGFGAVGKKTQQLQNGLDKPELVFGSYIRFLLLQIIYGISNIHTVWKLYKISTFVDQAQGLARHCVWKLYKISTFVDIKPAEFMYGSLEVI